MSRCAGFTILELAITSVIFAVTLGTAAIVAASSTETLQESLEEGEEVSQQARILDELEGLLDAVSLEQLEAIPQYAVGWGDYEFKPEPMQKDVAYNNVLFRKVTSFDGDEALYEPKEDLPAYKLFLDYPYYKDQEWEGKDYGHKHGGNLVFAALDQETVLSSQIGEFWVELDDSVLELTIVVIDSDGVERKLRRSILVRAP
jgi:hypothetical protein